MEKITSLSQISYLSARFVKVQYLARHFTTSNQTISGTPTTMASNPTTPQQQLAAALAHLYDLWVMGAEDTE